MSETELTIGQFDRFAESFGYRTEADRERDCLRIDDQGIDLVADLSLAWRSPGYPVSHDHPVTGVTWNDANAYIAWLGEQTGRAYRLPTELEWEYAARAMSTASRYWGDAVNEACHFANTAGETVFSGDRDNRRREGARSACLDGHLYTGHRPQDNGGCPSEHRSSPACGARR